MTSETPAAQAPAAVVPATVQDAAGIHKLVNYWAAEGQMLVNAARAAVVAIERSP